MITTDVLFVSLVRMASINRKGIEMRELELSRLIPATTLIRKAFYALGRSSVYTNNYENCHTVKAYSTGSDVRDAEIVNSILKLMDDCGYECVTAHMTESQWNRSPAIIIRIPK